ncbi:hypothetical protein NP493_1156g01006 [Ridgeia piscesae]|uniref:Glucosamine-6-phosphate deaminase n=1 Tax=Ridgeia piscesae TaxID=27915 RepID=A0AAD9KEJ2_RIDPI|nr:hypothetical protein NP493_1156g01006 [Ridgeia piscesae]
MKVVIMKDYEDVSDWTAKYIRKKILEFQPSNESYFVLGLSSGTQHLGLYRKLIELYDRGLISFKYVKTFNTCEYAGLEKDSTESTTNFMWNNFFQDIDITGENVNIMDGNAEDLDQECADYEAKIKEAGGIHLFVAGISANGDVGCNETGSSLVSRTRVKSQSVEVIRRNAKFFGGDIRLVPTRALTVGIATVMEAREVILLVTGEEQAANVKNAIERGVNHICPLSAFQQHEHCVFVLDENATLDLRVRTVAHYKGLCALTHFVDFEENID